jgi:hypothetical protein
VSCYVFSFPSFSVFCLVVSLSPLPCCWLPLLRGCCCESSSSALLLEQLLGAQQRTASSSNTAASGLLRRCMLLLGQQISVGLGPTAAPTQVQFKKKKKAQANDPGPIKAQAQVKKKPILYIKPNLYNFSPSPTFKSKFYASPLPNPKSPKIIPLKPN